MSAQSDTPETDAEHACFPMGGFTLDFARKLERERDKLKAMLTKEHGVVTISRNGYVQELERERDEWKAKYIQQNKDLGCELLDPNGTIWDHAKTLQRERDEARADAIRWKSIAEGRGHTDETLYK